MKNKTILMLVLSLALSIGGCNSTGERKYFLLEVQREGPASKPQKNVVLMVRPFALAPGFQTKNLTYRKTAFQYESDYYNQFITDIGQQVAEQTRGWLSQSGHFAHVVPPGTTVSATHMLEGNITRLYGDFRDKANPQAIVSITFYLIDISKRQPHIILSESFQQQAPIAKATPENLILAYQTCLRLILLKLENHLVQANWQASM